MAHIATTKDQQPADAARDLAVKGQGTTLRLVPKTPAPTATKHLARASVAAEMVQGSGALAHFWLEQASKQVACTAQTLRKLATARGWRERLEIQNAFVSGSLTWLNEGMVRHAAVTSAMAAHSREARASGAAAATSNSR
jgi:hypothetical protein